ncbi:hypothetical protein HYR69_10115 [Candidatus Sumerlaeota bacterium]|nr:hypothetical protein [Candidatus Sumerlaeota bacterium]
MPQAVRGKLNPNQLRSAAETRFDDARCLCESGKNGRMKGAVYLTGIAVECFLKAKLLEAYPWLKSPPSVAKLTVEERFLIKLCYKLHDLDGLLSKLPRVEKALGMHGQIECDWLARFKQACAGWSVDLRYSPFPISADDARDFLALVREVKICLR